MTTGNANPDPPQGGPDPKAYTESVVELSPTLRPIASFKDQIAGGDEDLATGNPVLLPNGDVFAIGKTDVASVLKQGTLAQVAAISGVCGSDPDGGPAFDAANDTMDVPCRGGGIQPVDLATSTVKPKLAGANGAPILIGSTLWAAEYPTGTLVGFNTTTGAFVRSLGVGSGRAALRLAERGALARLPRNHVGSRRLQLISGEVHRNGAARYPESMTAAPPFRADVVGSFLRPDRVKRAGVDYAAGRLDAAGLTTVDDGEVVSIAREVWGE